MSIWHSPKSIYDHHHKFERSNAINCKHMTITFLVKLVLAPTILMLTWYLHDIHESFGAIVLFMVQNYRVQSSRFMHQSQHKFLRIIIPAYNSSLKESPLNWFMGCCWVRSVLVQVNSRLEKAFHNIYTLSHSITRWSIPSFDLQAKNI